jgi:hypothetical protein
MRIRQDRRPIPGSIMRALFTSLFAGVLLGVGLAPTVVAQRAGADSVHAGPTHLLKTRDGSVLLGRVVAESADTIRFETAGGLLVLPRTSVLELRRIDPDDVHNGEYWTPDPNTTRLLFAPTARMLKQGEGYFNDTYLFFLTFAGGLTDNITLGGGASVFPIPDFSDNVFYLTPKVGLYSDGDVSFATGALIGFAGHENGSGGLLYGVGTKGGPDASATLGAGWAYGGNTVQSRPVLMLGGTRRMSRHTSFITENYFYTGDGSHALVSYGVRFFGEKLSVDLAFFNPLGQDTRVLFPGYLFLAFSTRF